jgi:hypothetical protein
MSAVVQQNVTSLRSCTHTIRFIMLLELLRVAYLSACSCGQCLWSLLAHPRAIYQVLFVAESG